MSTRLQTGNSKSHGILRSVTSWIQRNPQRVVELLMVTGVLLASILLVQILPVEYLLFPVILVIGLGALIIYLRTPQLGIMVFVIATLAISFEIGTSTSTGINLAVILLPVLFGLWLADMMIRKRHIQFVMSRPVYPLIAFAVICVLSFGIGQLPWFVYAKAAPILGQIAGLAIFLLSVVAFLLVANVITDLIWLKRMTWVFVIIGAFYFATRLFPQTEMMFARIFPRGIGGSLLWVWLIAVAMSQAWINRDLGLYKRLALAVLTGFLLYVGLIQSYDWKSGWIPQLTAVWIIVFFCSPRLAILMALVGLIFLKDLPAQVIASDEYSYSTRVVAWEIIWKELIRVDPLFGLGPANYYYYTPLFPIMGYNVQFNSHNNYLDIVAQVGILGLAAFMWFVVEIGALGLRLRKKFDRTYGFTQAFVIGTLAGLGGSLVAGILGDWFIPFVYNSGVRGFRSSVIAFLFLGGLVVIEQITAKQGDHRSQSQEG
jgi:hypothetical protein